MAFVRLEIRRIQKNELESQETSWKLPHELPSTPPARGASIIHRRWTDLTSWWCISAMWPGGLLHVRMTGYQQPDKVHIHVYNKRTSLGLGIIQDTGLRHGPRLCMANCVAWRMARRLTEAV